MEHISILFYDFFYITGNETLVDVFLHEEIHQMPYLEPSTSQYTFEPITVNHDSLHEEVFIKSEPEDEVDFLLSNNEKFLEDSYTPLGLDFEESPTELNSIANDLCKKPIHLHHYQNEIANLNSEESLEDIFKKPLIPDLGKKIQYSNRKSLNSNHDRKLTHLKCQELHVSSLELKLEKPGLDHDYCQEGDIVLPIAMLKVEPSGTLSVASEYSFSEEHSYCRPGDDLNTSDRTVESKEEIVYSINHQDDNKLRFGLDDSYCDSSSHGSKVSNCTPFLNNNLLNML